MLSCDSRAQYLQQVRESRFRSTLLSVVHSLDPAFDKDLIIRDEGYSFDADKLKEESATQVPKIRHAIQSLDAAMSQLAEIGDLRGKESSARRQAHYDLITSQLVTYRIRLHQTALALDQLVTTNPTAKNDKSNRWSLFRTGQLILPDVSQYTRHQVLLKLDSTREEYLEQLEVDISTSRLLLQKVIDRHPGTPWTARARYELQPGFGMLFRDVYQPPPRRPVNRPPPL